MMLHTLRNATNALQDADGISDGDKLCIVIHDREFNDIQTFCRVVRRQLAYSPCFDDPLYLNNKEHFSCLRIACQIIGIQIIFDEMFRVLAQSIEIDSMQFFIESIS